MQRCWSNDSRCRGRKAELVVTAKIIRQHSQQTITFNQTVPILRQYGRKHSQWFRPAFLLKHLLRQLRRALKTIICEAFTYSVRFIYIPRYTEYVVHRKYCTVFYCMDKTCIEILWQIPRRFHWFRHTVNLIYLEQRFSNFFQVGTTFISQNVLRTTLLSGLSNSLGLP